MKTANGPKKRGNGPNKRGNRSTNWELKTFYKNRKRTQKKRERSQKKEETDQQTENLKLSLKTGNGPKNRGNWSNVNIAETNPKIFRNPPTLFSFWGISDNSWKKKETDVSVLRRFHSTDLMISKHTKLQNCKFKYVSIIWQQIKIRKLILSSYFDSLIKIIRGTNYK